MDIKGFMYELAKRSDSEEIRALGRELLERADLYGDPALVLGFLATDWMKLVESASEKVDGTVDSLLASPFRPPGQLQ